MGARGRVHKVFALGLLLLAIGMALPSSFAAEKDDPGRWVNLLADAKADTGARMEAARRLGETRNPKYLPFLTEALKDNSKPLRWAAVEALWDMDDKRAVPALIEFLGKGEGYDWGKVLTMNALGSLKDPRAIDALVRMLENENPFLRRSAAMALVKIGDERAVPGIMRLLKDEEGWLQRQAQELLMELTKGKIGGEPPRGYENWAKWYQGTARHLRIERTKQE